MSQVMDNPSVNGSVVVPPQLNRDLVISGEQQGFDILKVLWRWKWLPIIGAMIGTGVGYLYFSKQPAEYQASALVQVISTAPPAPRVSQFDSPEVTLIGQMNRW